MRFVIYVFIISWSLLSWHSAFAAPKPEAFGTLPNVYDAAISPDAKHIAVFANVRGNYGVAIYATGVDGAAKAVKGVVSLGKGVKPQWIQWANNDFVLISIWQSEKVRSTPLTSGFLYALNTETMKGEYLIKPKRGIFRQYNNIVVDFLKDDPDHILMSFSDADAFTPDLKKVNVRTGRYGTVKRGQVHVQTWYTDLRGEPRIGQGLYDRAKEKWNLTIRDKDSKKWRKSDEFPGLSAGVDIYGFTADPDELVIGARQGKDTMGLYVYSLAAKKIVRKLFHNDEYDAGGVIYSADGKGIVGAKYIADTSKIELFGGRKTVLERIRAKYKAYTVRYVDQSQDGELILFNLSNAYDAGALMMFNTKTNEETLVMSKRPKLPSAEMGDVISVRYTARDGFVIPAYVTLPPSNGGGNIENLPFIILPHGGPYARSSKRFDYFAQFFASRGFGVLQMNFRGSEGYGKAFKDAGRENWVLMQEDVEDGARWLIRKGYADPDRLCIAGWSYGGYAALMGAIKNPDLYTCAVSMAGVTDLKDMINDIEKYRFGKLNAKNFVLKGFDNKSDIIANSPVKRAKELKIPLFIAHGTLDQRVHYDQFTRMKRALKKSSAKVVYKTFEDEDHFLSNQENRIEFFIELDKFLEENVGKLETAQ